jgi:hypothetical protein
LRAALELAQVESLLVEHLQALEERAAAVVHREHERRLARPARIDGLGRVRDQ